MIRVLRPRAATTLARGVCAAILFAAQTPRAAAVEPGDAASAARCSSPLRCFQHELVPLDDYRRALAGTESVEQARASALASAQQARAALDTARRIVFWNRGAFAAAYERLDAFEAQAAHAQSGTELAADLDGLLASHAPTALGVAPALPASCTYTTGEIIAIVLGLLLGIIPGLILLVLLC